MPRQAKKQKTEPIPVPVPEQETSTNSETALLHHIKVHNLSRNTTEDCFHFFCEYHFSPLHCFLQRGLDKKPVGSAFFSIPVNSPNLQKQNIEKLVQISEEKKLTDSNQKESADSNIQDEKILSNINSLNHLKKIINYPGTETSKDPSDSLVAYVQALNSLQLTLDAHILFFTIVSVSTPISALSPISSFLPRLSKIFPIPHFYTFSSLYAVLSSHLPIVDLKFTQGVQFTFLRLLDNSEQTINDLKKLKLAGEDGLDYLVVEESIETKEYKFSCLEDSLKVYFDGFSRDFTEKEAKEVFAKFGEIEDLMVIEKNFRLFGFVCYKEKESKMKAIEEGKVEWNGEIIGVNEIREREID